MKLGKMKTAGKIAALIATAIAAATTRSGGTAREVDSEVSQIDIWPSRMLALRYPAIPGGRRKATALARTTIVAGLTLSCCLACDSGNTSTCSSSQGGATNCGAGSTVSGRQPPSSSPTPTPGSVSGQVPEAPTSAGQAASTAPKSQYLSNLDSVASSGSLFTGNLKVNGRHYLNSVVQLLDPGPGSVSYNLGRQWRTLDMTLGVADSSTENEMVQFQVTADNRIIYTGDFTLGQSRHVRLNIAGVVRLHLTTTLVSNYTGGVYPDWGSAELLS